MKKIVQTMVMSAIFLAALYPAFVGAMEQKTQNENSDKTETDKKTTNEQQVDFAKLLALYFQASPDNKSCTGYCNTCGGCGKSEPKKTVTNTGTKKHRIHKKIDFEG